MKGMVTVLIVVGLVGVVAFIGAMVIAPHIFGLIGLVLVIGLGWMLRGDT